MPYREEDRGALVVRLARSWSSHSRGASAASAVSALGLFALAAALAVGLVLCLDGKLVVLAFGCFFGALVALMVGAILLFRAVDEVRRWRGVELAIQLDGPVTAGETVDARLSLIGRKRVPSVTVNLWWGDARVQLASIADLGRVDAGAEHRVVALAIPADVRDGSELEVIAEDMRTEPLVQRFRLPIRREEP